MAFHKEFVFLSTKRVLAVAMTMTVAVLLRSYWALVIGTVFGTIAGVVLSYAMQPYRPRLSLAAGKELLRFSGGLLAVNLLGAATARAPHFAVGRMYGPQALGIYTVASEFAYMPSVELIAPVNRAVFPGYARLAHDSARLRETFLDVIGAILLLALPASVGVSVIADPMVRVLLGERWLDAVPIVRVLAFAGAVAAVTSNNASAYLALGRTWLVPIALAVRLCVLIGLLLAFAARLGAIGAAYAELGAYLVSLLVSYPVLFGALQISVGRYLSAVWRPAIASAVMGGAVAAAVAAIPSGATSLSALPQLLSGVTVGVVVYTAVLFVLWHAAGRPRGAEAVVVARAARGIERLRARRSG